MNESILNILKAKLGITSTIRDSYLESIIAGVIGELRGKGIVVNDENTTSVVDERVNLLIADMSFKNYRGEEYSKNIESRIKDLILRDSYGSDV